MRLFIPEQPNGMGQRVKGSLVLVSIFYSFAAVSYIRKPLFPRYGSKLLCSKRTIVLHYMDIRIVLVYESDRSA